MHNEFIYIYNQYPYIILSLQHNSWAKGENDSRKTEIANLDNFAHSENDARKNEIANLDNFAKSENDGRKQVCIFYIRNLCRIFT